MATINKKPTKAHKDKKVITAHRGMAHVPRQRINRKRPINTQVASLKDRFEGGQTPAFARDAMRKAREKLRTRGPIAPRPQPIRTQIEPAVVQQPIKRRRPPRISDGSLDGGGRRTITPRKLTSRERRRQGNAFKSQADEMFRQYDKQRKQIKPRQPRVAMPYVNPAADNFPIGRPNVVQPYKPNPFVDNVVNVSPRFNSSTALTDRFTKQIEAQRKAFNEQNKNNLNQSRLQMRRSKGGDIKKYATGGLNNGMTKSRTKYGTVDNKKK